MDTGKVQHLMNVQMLYIMEKKIIITGGIGYIGTELCKIYSGISWNNEILVIDNRFISERVNQIRNWNMDFVHGDILDKELVSSYCKDADIVHHLAGITDVPRVKSEASKDHDEKINEYIINKLISPLTHNLNAHDKKTMTNTINLATLAIGYLPDMAFDLPGQQIHTDDFVKTLALIIDQGIKNT